MDLLFPDFWIILVLKMGDGGEQISIYIIYIYIHIYIYIFVFLNLG